MKKRHSSPLIPLFPGPDMYLVETSAWIDIDSRPDNEDVWVAVVSLINEGRLFTCREVLTELRDNPIYPGRLKQYENALLAGDRNDPTYLMRVGKITHDHPGMSRPTSNKTPADPYVVALAQLENYVVVTNETCARRPNRKIPGVCKQLNIRCLTLDQFVNELKAPPKPMP